MKVLTILMPVLVLMISGSARANAVDKSVDIANVCDSCEPQANGTAIVKVPVGGGDVKSDEEGGDKSATSALGAKSQKK
jgi:hypothetical protein